MAKSENTTSLPAFTRRKILVGATFAPLLPAGAVLQQNSACQAERDPVLALWREWQRLDAEAGKWLTKWQALEVLLFRKVGFPRVAVPDPDCEEALVYVIDHGDIDELLDATPENGALRKRLHADLGAQQARWDAAAAAVRFDAIEARHEAVQEQAGALMDEIFRTPAASMAGLAAKLALVLLAGEEREGDVSEFPWPQVRGVLADLRRLGGIPGSGGRRT